MADVLASNPLIEKPTDVLTPEVKGLTSPQKGVLQAEQEQEAFKQYQESVKRDQESMLSEGKTKAIQQYAQEREPTELKNKFDEYVKEEAKPFIPTQQTAGDLGTIFALTNIIGFAIGGGAKGSAQAALSAQNGMLEGYQKGNMDVYKQQKDIFEENQKALAKAVEGLKYELTQAEKTASVNKELAMNQAEEAALKYGGQAFKEYIHKFGIPKSVEYAKSLENMQSKNAELQIKLNQFAIEKQKLEIEKTKAAEAERHNKAVETHQGEVLDSRERQAVLDRMLKTNYKATVTPDGKHVVFINPHNPNDIQVVAAPEGIDMSKLLTPGVQPKAASAGSINARYAANQIEGMTQAAADIVNVANNNPDTMLGTFSGMTGKSGDSLYSSLANTFARNVTDVDARAYQQLISGLDFNMARALGGGYANSSAKAAIDRYKEQVPQSGDDPKNAAIFLARVRQEFEILTDNLQTYPGATPEMREKANKAMDSVRKVVPFTVDDVQKAIRGTKDSDKKTNSKGWVLHIDDKGRKAYVNPKNPNEYEEVK